MAIDILTLTPASLKAKEVATLEDVESAIVNDTTIIDGSRIITGSIEASSINTTGLYADGIAGNKIYGNEIIGGTIEGAYIEGAVIKSSWIDLQSTGYLTDWQYFTTGNPPPSEYLDNFAKDDTGALITPNGYYRLPKEKIASFVAINKGNYGRSYHNVGYSDVMYDIITNDEYQTPSTNRVARSKPSFTVTNSSNSFLNPYNYNANITFSPMDLMGFKATCDNHRIQGRLNIGDDYIWIDTGRMHPGTTWNTLQVSIGGVVSNYSLIGYTRYFTIKGLPIKVVGSGSLVAAKAVMISLNINNEDTITFNEDLTSSALFGATDMHTQIGHDCESTTIAVHFPTLTEVYN